MLKTNLKPHHGVVARKWTKRLLALVFFLSMAAAPSSRAQSNWVTGTAYGTNDLSTATSIASVANGAGSLGVFFPGTTDLTLSNNIDGTIIVSNNFTGFTIDATGGKVTGAQTTVLYVLDGTNLSITGGQFMGTVETTGSKGSPLDPLSYTNSVSIAARGGIVFNTSNVLISGSKFSGTMFNETGSTSYGTEGLILDHSTNVKIVDGKITGGDGGDAGSGSSMGGIALYVDSSTVYITNGTFTGGSSGSAGSSVGGSALYATNSSVTNSGNATFTGGNGAAALFARNSDLEINGGTYQGGSFGTNSYFGLLSIVDSGQSNNITLAGGTFNSIDFAGDGTQFLTAGTNLQVGGYMVLDGGMLFVDHQSDAPFQKLLIRSGSIDFLGDYNLADGGILEFVIDTNSYGTLSADAASFETNSTINVDASQAAFNYGTNDVTLVSTINGISIIDASGTTNNATATDLAENVNLTATTVGRTTLSEVLVDGGSNLIFRFTTLHLKDYLSATATFGDFIDELEPLMPDQMNTTINLFDNPDTSGALIEQTYFTTFNNFQTALQGMRAAVGQSISRGSEFRDQLRLIPPGARGPERNNQLRGWAKYYGNYFTHDSNGINPGYDTVLHGGVVGVETSLGNLLIGICGGSSQYRISYAVNAQADTVAYHGSLYGTYGMDRGYLDAGVTYGQNQVDTRTADPFRLDGSFDAQIASGHLGGGYDLIDIKGQTIFTPEASIQYATYSQDAYTEHGTAAVPRVINEFDADSILSTLGMNVSMLNIGRFDTFDYKVDLRLHWLHEFNPDPSSASFMLQGGSDSYQLAYPTLDEDLYRVGIGCSFFNSLRSSPKNVMLRLDFDELFGNGFNSHNLSAKLVYAF